MRQRFRYKKYIALALIAFLAFGSTGCSQKREPVTVTIWHVYGGQAKSPLNDLIDLFNETVGQEQNIQVQVGSVTNTNTIHDNVLSSAFGDPGAAELPDMFVSYPKTVLSLPDDTVLVDYRDYFTEEELAEFIPDFVEEGVIGDRLLILPVAKSTEILFVNQTAFDRFAAATGASVEELKTWEGLYHLAEAYAEWTDGKTFFVHDYPFNYFQVGVESLGESFFDQNQIKFSPVFEKVWKPYAKAALQGGVWLQSGYATEPLRTGDAIVSVASSASVLYYSDTVTYADNTTEKVDIVSMPCPIFEQGKKLVMQRGAGICTVKSTPEREKACMTFLKWLTDAQTNVDFVTKLGYMPVKREAFDACLPETIDHLENPMYVSLYQAFMETQDSYTFYTAPQMVTYLSLETKFEESIRRELRMGRNMYLDAPTQSVKELSERILDAFKADFQE